jgi:hypothetical protein
MEVCKRQGITCRTYWDSIDWWRHGKGTEKEKTTYNEIMNGWWKKKEQWELEGEKKCMEENKWNHEPTSGAKSKKIH